MSGMWILLSKWRKLSESTDYLGSEVSDMCSVATGSDKRVERMSLWSWSTSMRDAAQSTGSSR